MIDPQPLASGELAEATNQQSEKKTAKTAKTYADLIGARLFFVFGNSSERERLLLIDFVRLLGVFRLRPVCILHPWRVAQIDEFWRHIHWDTLRSTWQSRAPLLRLGVDRICLLKIESYPESPWPI